MAVSIDVWLHIPESDAAAGHNLLLKLGASSTSETVHVASSRTLLSIKGYIEAAHSFPYEGDGLALSPDDLRPLWGKYMRMRDVRAQIQLRYLDVPQDDGRWSMRTEVFKDYRPVRGGISKPDAFLYGIFTDGFDDGISDLVKRILDEEEPTDGSSLLENALRVGRFGAEFVLREMLRGNIPQV